MLSQSLRLRKLNQLFSHSMTMVEEDEEPEEWLLNTVPGTPIKVFEQWIMGLPDKGRGQKFTSDHSDHQHYLGKMTKEEAEHISHDHLVDQIVRNTRQLNVASDETNIDEEEGDHDEQNHHRRAIWNW